MAYASAAPVEAPATMAVLRAVLRPANLILGAAVLLGWACLLSWTGTGPGGWQARACAGLDHAPRACADLVPIKDQSRVVPHGPGFAS
ncbi:hypothetical protein [Methylobacterium sp. J-067]|uniref:hypothetical protein n=1 Tax=Methylobacterium sp. J-067 TaxID=2836648 RepID=UPI001FB998E4|nr:hypothetical protein [Methylobacterium sp. J-067]MCJ2025530.1 hypothetical protein [Methylobacterium sp. J-067]